MLALTLGTAGAIQTDNHGLHAVPAPAGGVKMDGDLSDWDLSGQMLITYDLESLRDIYSAQVPAMPPPTMTRSAESETVFKQRDRDGGSLIMTNEPMQVAWFLEWTQRVKVCTLNGIHEAIARNTPGFRRPLAE